MGMETRGLVAWSVGGALVLGYHVAPRLYTVEGLSAIATAGATLTALWLARAEARRRKDAEMEAASLAAAGLVADLEDAVEHLGHLVYAEGFVDLLLPHLLDDPAYVSHAATSMRREYGSILTCLESDVWALTRDDVHPLLGAGRGTSQRLLYACRLLSRVKRLADDKILNWDNTSIEQQARNIKYWHREMARALDMLLVAMDHCKELASIGAAPPTVEELFGPL